MVNQGERRVNEDEPRNTRKTTTLSLLSLFHPYLPAHVCTRACMRMCVVGGERRKKSCPIPSVCHTVANVGPRLRRVAFCSHGWPSTLSLPCGPTRANVALPPGYPPVNRYLVAMHPRLRGRGTSRAKTEFVCVVRSCPVFFRSRLKHENRAVEDQRCQTLPGQPPPKRCCCGRRGSVDS